MPEPDVENANLCTSQNRRNTTELSSLALYGRIVASLTLNGIISLLCMQILPHSGDMYESVACGTSKCLDSLYINLNPADTWILTVHGFLLPLLNMQLFMTMVFRLWANRRQCICRVHQLTILGELLTIIEMLAILIVAMYYGYYYIVYLPIALAQNTAIRFSEFLLQCPCRSCKGKPVIYFTYNQKIISLQNGSHILAKAFRQELNIPDAVFVVYDRRDFKFFTSRNLKDLTWPVYLHKKKEYYVKSISDFSDHDAAVISEYLNRPFWYSKDHGIELLILANHPGIIKYIQQHY